MNHQRAVDLLPWYTNGTLLADESTEVAAHVIQCDECQAEIGEYELLLNVVERVGEEEPVYDPSILDRALMELAVPTATALPEPQRPPTKIGSKTGFLRRLLNAQRPQVIQFAMAAQLALVVGLGAYIAMNHNGADAEPEYTTVSGDSFGDFSVMFSPMATMDEVQLLLSETQTEIVRGPSALGMYVIQRQAQPESGTEPDLQATLLLLKAREHVIYAEMVVQ